MGRLLCFMGIHSWRRISPIVRNYATGTNHYRVECRHCAVNEARNVLTWED